MFDPENIKAIQHFNDLDLLALPNEEGQRYEYKSSKCKDEELAKKTK